MKTLLRQFFELRPTASSAKIAGIVERLCDLYVSSPEDCDINTHLERIEQDIDFLPVGKPCSAGVSALFEDLEKYRNYDDRGLAIQCCELHDGRIKYIISYRYERFAPFRITHMVLYTPLSGEYTYNGWRDDGGDLCYYNKIVTYDRLLRIIADNGDIHKSLAQ